MISDSITTHQLQSTSVLGSGVTACTCAECSISALIVVPVACILVIIVLTTVAIMQFLLVVRMRKLLKGKENFEVVMTLTTTRMDVPDPSADVFAVNKLK